MKCLDGNYYVGVKDPRYRIRPTENFILRLRDPPKFLRTQYQVQKNTQNEKKQKGVKNDNDIMMN